MCLSGAIPALRERIALVKTYECKARRSGLNTEKGIKKAPDRTDDEIQVLRNGIIGRKPAKTLILFLPHRTIKNKSGRRCHLYERSKRGRLSACIRNPDSRLRFQLRFAYKKSLFHGKKKIKKGSKKLVASL
jgi:hypothetical protein